MVKSPGAEGAWFESCSVPFLFSFCFVLFLYAINSRKSVVFQSKGSIQKTAKCNVDLSQVKSL